MGHEWKMVKDTEPMRCFCVHCKRIVSKETAMAVGSTIGCLRNPDPPPPSPLDKRIALGETHEIDEAGQST